MVNRNTVGMITAEAHRFGSNCAALSELHSLSSECVVMQACTRATGQGVNAVVPGDGCGWASAVRAVVGQQERQEQGSRLEKKMRHLQGVMRDDPIGMQRG